MNEARNQFRLADVFGLTLSCAVLAALIRDPDSRWLPVVLGALVIWYAGTFFHAERRAPTRREWGQLLITAVVLVAGFVILGVALVFAIIKSSIAP